MGHFSVEIMRLPGQLSVEINSVGSGGVLKREALEIRAEGVVVDRSHHLVDLSRKGGSRR